ncbi:single-stranded DNA-binding protein [Corynebacterium comes]|uniref:Single-stranded DNA-binding protein n=1 Tax=Corynebacterium comes TaxID=2675218 RepID=A0A6B8VJ22_9CORY|nr:single-stranded DNA-binding protein [Corynebacterium comes]QGU05362.1 Single-stranded DNA-binding protein [Corynebacterium comes]
MTTITGNLTKDPELKYFEQSGTESGRLRVAVNRRVRKDEKWEDGPTLFISIEVWGQLARNCKISLGRGMPIVATGHLVHSEWQVEGEKHPRTQIMLKATHVGLDLAWHIASSRKTDPMDKRIQALNIPASDVSDLYDLIISAPPESSGEEVTDITAMTVPVGDGSPMEEDEPGF